MARKVSPGMDRGLEVTIDRNFNRYCRVTDFEERNTFLARSKLYLALNPDYECCLYQFLSGTNIE